MKKKFIAEFTMSRDILLNANMGHPVFYLQIEAFNMSDALGQAWQWSVKQTQENIVLIEHVKVRPCVGE